MKCTEHKDIESYFKADIADRLRKMRDEAQPRKTWPEGCYGSALSWLLFVGPSPGGSPAESHDSSRRKRTGGLYLWDKVFDAPYARRPDAWGGKYRENMPPLVETIIGLPLERGSAKLYGFANFDWIPSSQEEFVSRQRVRQGKVDVVKVMKLTRPRIIVPTTTKAYSLLRQTLHEEGYTFFEPLEQSVRIRIDPRGSAFHTHMDALKLKGRGVLSGSVVIRLPQHPARMLYRQHGHRCAQAMRKALVQVFSENRVLMVDET